MKKMTSILLGLSLVSTSAFAGQIYKNCISADSAGRECYSMPQETKNMRTESFLKVIKISSQNMDRDLQNELDSLMQSNIDVDLKFLSQRIPDEVKQATIVIDIKEQKVRSIDLK